MPQTKKQEIVYTVMMVCVMVCGMVCYNIALDVGGMQNFIFAAALSELPIMGVIGFFAGHIPGRPHGHAHRHGLVHPRQGQAGVHGGRYLLSVRVDDVPVDELSPRCSSRTATTRTFAMWVQTTAMNYPTAFCGSCAARARWCGSCLARVWPL